MNLLRYPLVLDSEETDRVTLEVLAERCGVHPHRIECYVEFGLLEPDEQGGERLLFSAAAVTRVGVIERLRRDIGVNLAGISVILELVERLRRAQQELERLRD
jgi:MerR family transcriptional regulator/heat shock protein HspR